MKKIIIFLIAAVFVSCDMFHNTDIGNMLETAQGTIVFNWAAVNPDLYSVKTYTNLTLTAKVTGTDAKIVSVEADLTPVGMGILSLEQSGDIWSNQVWVKTVTPGNFTIVFNAVNEYGKSVQFSNNIRVFQNEAIYVAGWGDDTNSGITNSSPVRTILKAAQLYELNGAGEIRVATGVYDDYFNNYCVLMKAGMIIHGGYDDTFAVNDPALYPTKIDGLSGNVLHVIVAVDGGKCTLDGLIISRGIANDDFLFGKHGGGVLVLGTEMVIKNCIIESNYALQCGGGIYVMSGSVTISNTLFRQNIAMSQGGACFLYDVAMADIDTVMITNTYAESGGGIYGKNVALFTMDNSVIADVTSKKSGGSLYLENGSFTLGNSILHSCSLFNGTEGIDIFGGTAFFASGILSMKNCVFSNNSSSNTVDQVSIRGCGLYLSAITNFSIIQSKFYKNTCYSFYGSQGGAIMLGGQCWGKIISNQISMNSNSSTYNYGGSGIQMDFSVTPMIIDYNLFDANYPGNIYEGYITSQPTSLKFNRFLNTTILYYDYTAYDITSISALNSLDENGYNPAGSVSGNTTN
ncbi:MAG: hypothetical protein A2014_11160 [Spirochaetes bacterium GWF1_49_6]|nr:MAG: hypothetical protein A2014_11160 [Spirochaetes bacterium GWF1_49_6]